MGRQAGSDDELMPRSEDPGRNPLVPITLAVISTVFSTLSPFLVGALAIYIRADLGFDEQQLGLTVSVFHLAAAVMAIPLGHLGERWGATRGMLAGVAISGASILGVALLGNSWLVLTLLLGLAGVGNAMSQPSANLLLARMVPPARQGLAFGAKQAAVPAASMLSGLSVPLIGVTLGWRWAFVLAALLGPLVAVAILRLVGDGKRPARPRARAAGGGRPSARLVVMAVSAGLAVAASSTLGPFFVESSVAHGLTPERAGVLLAIASVGGIAARAGWGWFVDRRGLDALVVSVVLMVVGSGGLLLHALGHGRVLALLLVGTAGMFIAAWGWNGLLTFAIVQRNMDRPAAASGVAIAGFRAGGILGPLGFGTLVAHWSYPVAWTAAAVTLGVAAAILFAVNLMERARGVQTAVDTTTAEE